MTPLRLLLALALLLARASFAADPGFPPMPPVQPLTPTEEQKTFQLPPGYRLELVLSEPKIREPVICAFDGNGRMFVAEMLSYMQDIDGTDELTPVSRVSMHVDADGDGRFEKHTVFADNLLLPRMILPLGESQLVINETNTLDLYLHTDMNGDGVADKKELWWKGGPRGGNLEHQPNGLIWAIDNWLYTTYNTFRLRWTPGGVIKDPSAPNNGQWGVGQDNHGRIFFMNAGGEQGPQSFQAPIVYGGFNPRGQFAPGFSEVFPAAGKADVQGGAGRFRPDGTLNHFTATSGAEIYRGDRLPAELHGDLFFGEPVGRLVRRAKVEVKDGLTVLSNPHQAEKSEFIRSTDLCFRPLNMITAPDGTLYIVDMYRGIIQEGNWVREGSYLRKVVKQHSFDKVTDRGRIWRLVHDTTRRGPQPSMFREQPAQLVAHLAHPNGWWRDTAQKLLVLKQDKSVVPALATMARTHASYLARLHALWTLEGLGAADAALVRDKLRDETPHLRAAAIRVSESLFKAGDQSLQADVKAMSRDAEPEVALQAGLTARLLNWPDHKAILASVAGATPAAGVKTIVEGILNPPVQKPPTPKLTPEEKRLLASGAEIYNTLCASCHGPQGKGMPMAGAAPGAMLAPALAGSKTVTGHRNASILVLLHGLVGEIDGRKYEGQMIPMANNSDGWVASVLSYVRNSFGNRSGFILPEEVAQLREATKARTQPWTITELRAAVPSPLPERKKWKVTASHHSASARSAIDGDPGSRFDTSADQTPGMWFQIELPEPATITELRLDTGGSAGDYPRGYKVELSSDGREWGKPVAEGKGRGPSAEITFPASTAKFIRITQTGRVSGLFWSIHELDIYGPGSLGRH